MITLLLIVIVLILLFGASSVKTAGVNVILFLAQIIALVVICIVGSSIIDNVKNNNWVGLAQDMCLVLFFIGLCVYGGITEKKEATKINASFSLENINRLPYVKIKQGIRFVLLSPAEVRNLLKEWNTNLTDTYTTIFMTTFKKITTDNSYAKKYGLNFEIEIRQYKKLKYQTNDSIRISTQTLLSLSNWMENIVSKNEVARKLYQ